MNRSAVSVSASAVSRMSLRRIVFTSAVRSMWIELALEAPVRELTADEQRRIWGSERVYGRRLFATDEQRYILGSERVYGRRLFATDEQRYILGSERVYGGRLDAPAARFGRRPLRARLFPRRQREPRGGSHEGVHPSRQRHAKR
jgi:hypothetical protein